VGLPILRLLSFFCSFFIAIIIINEKRKRNIIIILQTIRIFLRTSSVQACTILPYAVDADALLQEELLYPRMIF
jgi:hypothetical protein